MVWIIVVLFVSAVSQTALIFKVILKTADADITDAGTTLSDSRERWFLRIFHGFISKLVVVSDTANSSFFNISAMSKLNWKKNSNWLQGQYKVNSWKKRPKISCFWPFEAEIKAFWTIDVEGVENQQVS
jgi:hypothetical protein